MALVLEGKLCGACRQRHTLFLKEGNLTDAGKKYEYDCPVVERTVSASVDGASDWWRTVDASPRDAVEIREVA